MYGLTGLDIIVLLAIFGGAIFGLMRGFVTEVIALFAWVAAILALKLFHGHRDQAAGPCRRQRQRVRASSPSRWSS